MFELKIIYGVDYIDPQITPIANSEVRKLVQSLIPIDICRRYELLPLAKKETDSPSVLVAMVKPDNLAARDELKRILTKDDLQLQRLVIAKDDYARLLEDYLNEQNKQKQKQEEEKAVDVTEDIANIDGIEIDEHVSGGGGSWGS